jgi:hypothetical protein
MRMLKTLPYKLLTYENALGVVGNIAERGNTTVLYAVSTEEGAGHKKPTYDGWWDNAMMQRTRILGQMSVLQKHEKPAKIHLF